MQQQRFGIARQLRSIVLVVIEHVCRHPHRLGAPAPAGVANDSEKPGACVPPCKGWEVAKRAQCGLLHNVFRIMLVSNQPACQTVCSVEVWQDDVLEPFWGDCAVSRRDHTIVMAGGPAIIPATPYGTGSAVLDISLRSVSRTAARPWARTDGRIITQGGRTPEGINRPRSVMKQTTVTACVNHGPRLRRQVSVDRAETTWIARC